MSRPARTILSSEEFVDLAVRLGAAHRSARPTSLEGVASVRDGETVAMGDFPVDGSFGLTQWRDDGGAWRAVNDRIELDIHGAPSMTHLDTTAHFDWDHGIVTAARDPLLELAERGLVARGVLIDVPTMKSGEVMTLEDVVSALDTEGVEPRPGDALYLRFGRTGPLRGDVPIGSSTTSGLSIECAEWFASVAPSVVITDEGLDSTPSEVDGQPVPWHLLLLTVLGIPLVDRAQLTPLAERCSRGGRWEFLSVIAPLPLPAVSGSPVNPLAVF